MAGYEGFAELGNLITGGEGLGNGARRGASHPDRMKQNFDAFDALNQARISRAQANARERLSAQMVAGALGGDPAALGELGATTMGMAAGQPNLGTFTGGLKDLGDIEVQRQQMAAAESGDVTRLNHLTAIASDKVLDRTKITDGVAFDPLGTPDQDLVVTPLGAATIGQREAAAQGSLMRAGAYANSSNARAGLYSTQSAAGGWNPTSGKPKGFASETEAETKLQFLYAEASRMAAKNGNEWADAWLAKEMAKAGFDPKPLGAPEPAGPLFRNVQGGSSTVPARDVDAAIGDTALLSEARDAIARGAKADAVRRRLREMGRADLAGAL